MKFGKLEKTIDNRNLLFKNYINPTLVPASSYSNTAIVYKKLGISNPSKLFPMDGNDNYGDCVICMCVHGQTTWNGLIGKKKIMSSKSVIKTYLKLTGGEDTGLSELDTLKHWHNTAINGEKILVFVEINPKNHDHIKLAIELFGGIMLGMNVQKNTIVDFDNGITWTPGKLILNEGHAIFGIDYDENTISVLTWGGIQKGTYDWVDCAIDEAYGVMSIEAKNPIFNNGKIDEQTLLKDLQLITN
jgi:hypothetical protein